MAVGDRDMFCSESMSGGSRVFCKYCAREVGKFLASGQEIGGKKKIRVTFTIKIWVNTHLPVFAVIGLRLDNVRLARTLDEEVCRSLREIVDAARSSHWIVHATVETVLAFVQ